MAASENTIYFKISRTTLRLLSLSCLFQDLVTTQPAVSGLIFTGYLLARCCFVFTLGDDTLKIWDLRNFKEYLNVAMNLTNYYPQ